MNDVQLDGIKADTLQQLEDAGYDAYDVTSENYTSVQTELKTDFGKMGLDPENSYIVVISGENNNPGLSRAYDMTPFEFTYNGHTHTMRYFIVFSYDDYHLTQASNVQLINSNNWTIVENAFNAAVTAIADNVAGGIPFGTVLSICGLNLVNFNHTQQTTLVMFAGTNWTRLFTQILDDGSDTWVSWSVVEYAVMSSYFGGQYYDVTHNRYVQVPDDECVKTIYSPHYNDMTWRKQQAAIGWTYSFARKESTGDIQYLHDGDVVITHANYYG